MATGGRVLGPTGAQVRITRFEPDCEDDAIGTCEACGVQVRAEVTSRWREGRHASGLARHDGGICRRTRRVTCREPDPVLAKLYRQHGPIAPLPQDPARSYEARSRNNVRIRAKLMYDLSWALSRETGFSDDFWDPNGDTPERVSGFFLLEPDGSLVGGFSVEDPERGLNWAYIVPRFRRQG